MRTGRLPLTGHLDVEHVGIVEHSLGCAKAIQVIANDSCACSAAGQNQLAQLPHLAEVGDRL